MQWNRPPPRAPPMPHRVHLGAAKPYQKIKILALPHFSPLLIDKSRARRTLRAGMYFSALGQEDTPFAREENDDADSAEDGPLPKWSMRDGHGGDVRWRLHHNGRSDGGGLGGTRQLRPPALLPHSP